MDKELIKQACFQHNSFDVHKDGLNATNAYDKGFMEGIKWVLYQLQAELKDISNELSEGR